MGKFFILPILSSVFFFMLMIPNAFSDPVLTVQDLAVEKYVSGLCCSVTTMTFVGDDILILQKSDGVVRLIKDGVLQAKPVLDVSVNSIGERGMLGIASVDSLVYLYFTEANADGGKPLGNRIYKYEWDGSALINPILLKELPSADFHNGGAMVAGLDDKVYAVIGDTGRYGLLQNKPLELLKDSDVAMRDNGVILQVESEGPYYAMGIRNSFGLAVDPDTGNLWDTENGDDDFDEINLVQEKFNSGWIAIMGPATESQLSNLPGYEDYVYDDPEFSWEKPIAPTGLAFTKFQETPNYDNSLFVGDCNYGNLYKFELNKERNGFEFTNSWLKDNVINRNETMDEIIVGTGFGCISDVERGPDGFLYVISLSDGAIYKIIPKNLLSLTDPNIDGGGCLIATATYGSELSSQVQQLRELRDNSLLKTKFGSTFMVEFNEFYYSFSPSIADWERQNPVFKEAVKIAITPMISSISILNYVDMDSEEEILGYGVGVILLNIGMYFVAPMIIITKIRKHYC
ncbi:MAG: PQQ-dependent sugar dehydrogenase [Nitrosopumilaceae archaeon]